MIISDLCDEYAVLVSQNKAPVYGYDNVNVPYGLVINDDGILVEVRLLGDFSGKKPINKISVPARFVKTSGIVPDFLCGNAEYMLGYNTEKPEHAVKAFQACAQLHMQILEGIDDPVASAVRAFFLQGPQWEIAKRLMGDCWESSLKMNFALQHVDGAQTIFVGDFPGIQKAWNTYYDQKGNDDKSSLVSSLVSGKLVVPEKTHPRIKNVAGAHPAGSALITFNAAAFCSHGAVQNENAPMSKREAYEYTTALNTLLADESRVQRIGNDTVISWACCGNAVYSDLFSGLYSSETQSNGLDEKTIKDATCALAQGRRYDYEGIRLNPDEHFHILALSPNKSRLAIRFYLTDTFGVFAHNIEQYYQDTEIRRPRYDKTGFLPILRLLGQTIRKQRKDENAPVKKQKKKSAIENVSSEMVSAIMQAILNGTPYPVTLINVVERRINVERDVPPDKAAIIKAYYLRKTTNEQFKEVLQMDINEESEYLPYVLGRIFSIYEQIQLGAIPNINTTIKDKYFTSASTTPARIFPILGDLAAKHMRKAWKSEGLKIKLDKVLGTLTQKVGDHYPSRLSLEERGAFQLGYYFENQKRFNKTNKSNEDNEQGENYD